MFEKFSEKDAKKSNFSKRMKFRKKSNILFIQNAIWILNTLLTFNVKKCSNDSIKKIPQMFALHNGVYLPITTPSHIADGIPIVDLFLLANQLISHLQNEMPDHQNPFHKKELEP
jgi:hypothetical protein